MEVITPAGAGTHNMDVFSSVDRDALNLTRAIAASESGDLTGKPNYNVSGKSGERGAYQWMPGNFEAAANEAGLNPVDFSPENQDKVAYYQVKKYKDQGLQPWEIASIWNSGSKDNWKDHRGVNKYGVKYDTPAYVAKVKQHYTALSGNPTPTGIQSIATQGNLPADAASLGNQIGKRFQNIATAASEAASGRMKAPLISAPLQIAGQAAGGVGDVINAGLGLIPGFNKVEEVIGKGVQAAAGTPLGQEVVKGVTDFSAKHPELSKDIAAAGNIATLLPAGKAVGLAVGSVKTVGAKVGAKAAEQAVKTELESALGTTVKGRGLVKNASQRGFDPVQDAIDHKILPEVVETPDGKFLYSTAKADELAGGLETKLEDELRTLAKGGSNKPISLTPARNTAIAEARKEMRFDPELPRVEQRIRDNFDHWTSRFGDKQTLDTMIDMKRDVRSSLGQKSFFEQSSLDKKAALYTGQGLMRAIEDTAGSRGVKGVLASGAQTTIRETNQTIARLINLRKMLANLEGKAVKNTKSGKVLQEMGANLAGAGGEFLGGMTGIPFAGTLAGRALGAQAGKNVPKSALLKLEKAQKKLPSIQGLLGGIAPLTVQQGAAKESPKR